MMETWKPIAGYDNYVVSDLGNIARILGDKLKPLKSRVKNIKTRGNALRVDVGLRKDGKYSTKSVHRLVLRSFNPVVDMDSLEVDHIDGNRLNNSLSNLRWVTPEQNKKFYREKARNIVKCCPHCNKPLS